LKELLAIDGIFASMWADQVSSDDVALSINGTGIKNEISGYSVEPEETKEEEKPQDIVETMAPIAFPAAPVVEPADVPKEEESVKIDVPPVAASEDLFPQPDPVDDDDTPHAALIIPIPVTPVNLQPSVSAFVEFPTTSEMPQPEIPQPETPQPEIPEMPQPELPQSEPQPETPQPEMRRSDSPVSFTPAVTFGLNVNSPPSRTGTPGPEDEPKRKRISSQNFQRLARRISLSTRRQSSVSSMIPNIPGFKRSESPMARVSTDDNDTRAESSTSNSPASSVKGNSKKKDKKDKKTTT
jgi:hypothetical protein